MVSESKVEQGMGKWTNLDLEWDGLTVEIPLTFGLVTEPCEPKFPHLKLRGEYLIPLSLLSPTPTHTHKIW